MATNIVINIKTNTPYKMADSIMSALNKAQRANLDKYAATFEMSRIVFLASEHGKNEDLVSEQNPNGITWSNGVSAYTNDMRNFIVSYKWNGYKTITMIIEDDSIALFSAASPTREYEMNAFAEEIARTIDDPNLVSICLNNNVNDPEFKHVVI